MNIAAHQGKEEENTGKKQTVEERKQSTDFKNRLRAVFLRSFGGQHGQKMVCIRGVYGKSGTLWKANSHLDSTQTGSGTAPPR